MEKKQIETFIKKYNLGGLIEGVVWQNNNDNLLVTAMTSDRKLFTSVQLEKGAGFFKGVEIAIQDTNKLKKMLNILSDNISLSLDMDENDATRVLQIVGDDGMNTIYFSAAEKGVLDPVPSMKNIPPFGVEAILTPEFIEAFTKAVSALSDDQSLFTLVMSKKKQKLELVLGYKQLLSDKVALGLTLTPGKDTVNNPISFSAKHLKELLAANSELLNPVLSVSEAGLASINFDGGGFKSQYFLVKIDVED